METLTRNGLRVIVLLQSTCYNECLNKSISGQCSHCMRSDSVLKGYKMGTLARNGSRVIALLQWMCQYSYKLVWY